MKLTIQGTSDWRLAHPRASAGYLVEHGDTAIKLDFGRGNLVNMAITHPHGVTLNAIILSHTHPDHLSDLIQYLQIYTLMVAEKTITQNLQIFGPEGFASYFERLRDVIIIPWDHGPTVHELHNDEFMIGSIHVTTHPMHHAIADVGVRLEADGKTVCYPGDTGPNANLVALASGVDILLTECYADNSETNEFHMRPTDVAQLARDAHVKKVVLTHWQTDPGIRTQRLQQIKKEYDGDVVCADDNMMIEL